MTTASVRLRFIRNNAPERERGEDSGDCQAEPCGLTISPSS
jgi:hypothetical protein